MSEWVAEVFRIDNKEKHPNADTLSIVNFKDYPCIVKTEEFNLGDLVVYVPVDSIMPDEEQYKFLGSSRRIKAKRLRGVFSMGLIIKAPEGVKERDIVNEIIRIEKWEPKDESNLKSGDQESDPHLCPVYDVEGLRKFKHVLQPGEEVVVTEKLHGTNARYFYHDGKFYAGSHRTFKKEEPPNLWWDVAKEYDLLNKLSNFADLAFYGEIYGWVQKLRYGHKPGIHSIAFFDIYDIVNKKWLLWDQIDSLLNLLNLPKVPIVHIGPWHSNFINEAEKKSLIAPDQIKEGIVIRSRTDRWDERMRDRVHLKYPGENYLVWKGEKEQ